MALVTEDQVELQSIEWFQDIGYNYLSGYVIAPDGEEPPKLILTKSGFISIA